MTTPKIVTGPLATSVSIKTWRKASVSTGGKVSTPTWAKLVERYLAMGRTVRTKDMLPAPSFAVFRDECTPDNCMKAAELGKTLRMHRCDDAVISVTAMVLDQDDGKPWDTTIEFVRSSGLAAILYESPSHKPEYPKWRLVLPLSEPFARPRDWQITYGRFRLFVSAVLGIEFDPKCSNPSRVFFPPTRETEDTPPREVLWIDGAALDLEATLRTLPPPATVSPTRAIADASSIAELDSQDRDGFERWAQGAIDKAIDTVSNCGRGSRNNTLNEQAFSIAARFVAPGILDGRSVGARLIEAAQSAGLSESEARATVESAMRGGKAKGSTVCDMISEWRNGRYPRRVNGYASASDPYEIDDEPEPEPPPWVDPETGEVLDPAPPSPPELPTSDILDGLSLPDGYEFRKHGLVRIQAKPSNVKTCPCGAVNPAKANTCSCGENLPSQPDVTEVVHQIAHVPIWIGAELQRREGNLWRIDARIGKRVRRAVVERALKHDARKLAMAIEAPGIPLCASKHGASMLAEYLDRFDVINRKRIPRKEARTQFGWDEKCESFLLGREPVGTDSIALYAANGAVDRIADWIVPVGIPEVWRDTAQAVLEASPVAALVLAASVASPMLRPFGWAPIGIALAAIGGGNKSTLLRLAASAWGFHGDAASRQAAGLVGNGNATVLGVVGQFTPLADLPHLVDEMRANVTDQRARAEFEGALHQLIDGVERTRLKRDGTGPRDSQRSPGCAVIATEIHTDEFLVKGGAVRRYLPAPAPYASHPLGGHIEALCASYGHAGPKVVRGLVEATTGQRGAMAERRGGHLARLREGLDSANESLRTWSDQLAVALAAADVACQLCPDVMPDHDLWTSQLLACWESLREVGGGCCSDGCDCSSGDTVTRSWQLTRAWVATMRAHLLPSPDMSRLLDRLPDEERRARLRDIREPIIGRVHSAQNEGEQDEHLRAVHVTQPALREFLAKGGYSAGTIVAAWAERGWVEASQSRRGFGVPTRIGGTVTECYRLKTGGAQ